VVLAALIDALHLITCRCPWRHHRT